MHNIQLFLKKCFFGRHLATRTSVSRDPSGVPTPTLLGTTAVYHSALRFITRASYSTHHCLHYNKL